MGNAVEEWNDSGNAVEEWNDSGNAVEEWNDSGNAVEQWNDSGAGTVPSKGSRGAPSISQGGGGFFPCIVTSRVRKNELYVSYLPCCRLPQSSHIAKNIKNRLQRCKLRNLTKETLKI